VCYIQDRYASLLLCFADGEIGWTLLQFGFIVCLITTTHFAAEAYPSNPGPALVLVVGMKNIVSFGKTRSKRSSFVTWRLTALQVHPSASFQWFTHGTI
jgi:hypothetical protein